MRLPRDISSTELIKSLRTFGYQISRQKGSHIRLTTFQNGEHHITIPNHDAIRLGTLSSIINDIASHFKKTKEEIASEIFK
jgi:predicted RNA binding protein YcfA (HicA-like mRNA interferase family)